MSDLPTSKELVKSLRDYSEGPTFYWGPICQKAAEEIERLQRELAASAAQYQEACDDANRFARERDEARASPEPCALQRHKAGDLYANVDVYVAVEVDACTGPPPDADAALDRAYYNGAKQALAMANDSIEAANKWLADGCGGRRTASTKGGEL